MKQKFGLTEGTKTTAAGITQMDSCDICGQKVTEAETKIYGQICSDDSPCYCSIVKRIAKLENI